METSHSYGSLAINVYDEVNSGINKSQFLHVGFMEDGPSPIQLPFYSRMTRIAAACCLLLVFSTGIFVINSNNSQVFHVDVKTAQAVPSPAQGSPSSKHQEQTHTQSSSSSSNIKNVNSDASELPTFYFSLKRVGYSTISSISSAYSPNTDDTSQLTYTFLKSYVAVIEPYANMTLEILADPDFEIARYEYSVSFIRITHRLCSNTCTNEYLL